MHIPVQVHIGYRIYIPIAVLAPLGIRLAVSDGYVSAHPEQRCFQPEGNDKPCLWDMGNCSKVGVQIMGDFSVDHRCGAASVGIEPGVLVGPVRL